MNLTAKMAKKRYDPSSFHFYRYKNIRSTNDAALLLSKKDHQEWSVITSESQSGGRGRKKRNWESKKGGLYLSVILHPRHNENLQLLTFCAALAITKTIRSIYGIQTQIKWPNDILLNGKKICGILTESIFSDRTISVIGIGLNILQQSFSSPLKDLASSLLLETKKDIPLRDVESELLRELFYQVSFFNSKKFNAILSEWKKQSSTIGKEVTIFSEHSTIHGKAVDIRSDGALLITDANGKRIPILEGDVSVRHPS